MWPQLFGVGSELGLLVAGGMIAGIGAIVWYAMRPAQPVGPDPVADLWRAYEQGEITSWEAGRLFRIFAAQTPAAGSAGPRARDERRTGAEDLGRGFAASPVAVPAEVGQPDLQGV
ncbi:MAG TPA: hypothetical protein VJT33_05330 [bacterium]|nr:hypothetical protein [bacterium]